MNPWIYVAAGGIFEAIWAVTMNMSDGFTDPVWVIVTLAVCMVSVWFLNHGFRAGLPVGSCYATWTGCGTVLSTVFGILFFGQVPSLLGFLFLAVLVGGILLLQSASPAETEKKGAAE
ncbi:MAG: DMT family transporter [Methanomethylophilus sp.]|jgi:quaternary ammonium compound-resistance protein SugE